jgi:hypothetical protein
MDQIQIHLALLAAMLERRKQIGIVGGKTGQLLGIVTVVLRFAARDGRNLARVGLDHLMAQRGQKTADPGRMRAALQRDAHTRLTFQVPP